MRTEIYRNQTKFTETKRNGITQNKGFNVTISWGKTRQKLNEKNRESII